MDDGLWHQDYTWLAPGCTVEGYGYSAIRDCVTGRKMVFAGDLQVQATYWAMVRKLDGNVGQEALVERDLRYSNDFVELEYSWDPMLNGSALSAHLEALHDKRGQGPMLMVIGAGRWHVENGASGEFGDAVDRIISAAHSTNDRQVDNGMQSLSVDDGPGDLLLIEPVQQPYWKLSEPAPPTLGEYHNVNAHLRKRADEQAIDVLWSFAKMTALRRDKYTADGMEVQDEVSRARADLLLNLRCNAKAASTGRFPNTRTCCASWRRPNWQQSSFLLLGLAVLPAMVLLDWRWQVLGPAARPVVYAFSAFTFAISLQYITDRTHLFEQAQRLELVDVNLRNMLATVFLIGLVSVRRIKAPKRPDPGEKPTDQSFLPRDQTDEWRGWLQACIIIYHYNKAWSALWYWEIIRTAVASYLFLTGFGHTVYFLQKQDYSFRRVAAVLVRTNLLPCTLAYVMRTRWLLYYYMPLSSFWFLVIYATMAVGQAYNKHTPFLVGKIVASAGLLQAFVRTPDLPETVVRLFEVTCKISFNANEFFHRRVTTDAYIVYIGMLVAMFYVRFKQAQSDPRQDTVSRYIRRDWPWFTRLAIAVSLVGFLYFWRVMWYGSIHSEAAWGAWQPYITWIPILTFVTLRNAHPFLRNFHSAAFAWLGRYSGEMYVMQNHIWLAGDQEAILRTGFFRGDETVSHDRWRDLLVVTPLYLVACCIIGEATSVITTWFVAEDKQDEPSLAAERPLASIELGLLNGADEGDEESLSEKSARPTGVMTRTWRAAINIWPSRVRERAILVLACMWFLNMVRLFRFGWTLASDG